MGSSEGGNNYLLHQTDSGRSPIPAWKPDRPPRHQGRRNPACHDTSLRNTAVTSIKWNVIMTEFQVKIIFLKKLTSSLRFELVDTKLSCLEEKTLKYWALHRMNEFLADWDYMVEYCGPQVQPKTIHLCTIMWDLRPKSDAQRRPHTGHLCWFSSSKMHTFPLGYFVSYSHKLATC